jgi:1-acyl-sn-glycerol-3-phosphate acyltransferase
VTRHARLPAVARRALWRTVLTLTGGLRVYGAGALPAGPCVIVANHQSHADTAALIAALPARRRPAVAAAADYWFRGGMRPWICRVLCAAFPVRRAGGGSADLAAAGRLLATGHDVIVYPEGSRSRDGQTARFHRGAAGLAATAGVPLVPVAIGGTAALLPPGGPGLRLRRATVLVLIGAPVSLTAQASLPDAAGPDAVRPDAAGPDAVRPDTVTAATEQAHARVVAMAASAGGGGLSRIRR